MMKATIEKGSLYIFDCDIDLYRTFNCGQAFRWKSVSDSVFTCVLGERIVTVSKEADCIAISPCENEIDKAFYTHYFDLERDYTAIEDYMLSNTVLSRCIPYAKGIRILNQAPFETLISFIISANNNIKRISKTIDNLCAAAGRRIGDTNHYTFPTPQSIADLSIEDLLKIGTGYRASYIKDTAIRICEGFPLEELRDLDYCTAKSKLMELKGVGGKVADCILLFSLGHYNAFPMDVWMKRAVNALFFNGKQVSRDELCELIESLGANAGIIQQYIFHYARQIGIK